MSVRRRSRRTPRLSAEDLELGKTLLSQFNAGSSFESLCTANSLTKTKARVLMMEATRAIAASGVPKPDHSAVGAAVEQGILRGLSTLFDSESLREIVQDEVSKYPPQSGELTITVPDSKVPVTIKQSHSMLKEMLRRIGAGFENLLIVGPAGSGKTTLASQVAVSLKRKFGFISLSGGTTEGQLLGRLTSTGKYLPSLFVQCFEEGGVFLLDEVDAADANVLLVLNSALANGELAVPSRVDKPVATRHEKFVLIAAANTWGTGADWQYVGRNQLDAAFLSRFAGSVLSVNYDAQLERALTVQSWYDAFVKVRNAAHVNRLRRILGTREMLAGQRLLKAGYTTAETWEALTAGWTPDERSKARIEEVL